MELQVNKTTAELVFAYCIFKHGKHKRKPVPTLKWSLRKNNRLYGEYFISENVIKIYANAHIDIGVHEMIDTIFHEYKHYLQNLNPNTYKKRLTDLEKEAVQFAKKETKKFIKELSL